MELNQIFYTWVPKYVRYVILLLMVFVALCANGVYLGITTNMYSELGVYIEPYTLAANTLYIGMGAGMLFLGRLVVRFSLKSLIITAFIIMLLMNLIIATTNNPILAIAGSLVLGFFKMLAIGPIYLAWAMIWSKTLDASRVYPFFYFVALAGLNFITWLTAYFTNLYSWRYAYIIVFILIILCMILAILLFERHNPKRKYPLYQLDIPGLLLLITALMFMNYIVVYGKVEDWFQSNAVSLAAFGAVIALLLFINRELTVKRPILDLNLFKKFTLTAGLILFLIMGVLNSTTFQSALSGSILHFELIRNAELGLYLIPGIFAGCMLTFYWYKKKYQSHTMFIIGFSAIVMYHILMYLQFVNDLNIDDFVVPIFLRGFALATLYISIGLYALTNIQIPVTLKGVGLILIVRSFLGTGISSGVYNYLLYASTNRHLNSLAVSVDANESLIRQFGGPAGYNRYIVQQASLGALKELSGNIIIFGITIVILLTILRLVQAIKKRAPNTATSASL